jgi:hypothetical protein
VHPYISARPSERNPTFFGRFHKIKHRRAAFGPTTRQKQQQKSVPAQNNSLSDTTTTNASTMAAAQRPQQTEEEETRRYREELETLERKWSKDDFTDREDCEYRKYGFDDLVYNKLNKEHRRNLGRIRRRNDGQTNKPSPATLWDFIATRKNGDMQGDTKK